MNRVETTYVVLPGKRTQCDRVDVLVENDRKRDSKVEHVETLGTQLVRQNFDRVRNDEGRECDTG